MVRNGRLCFLVAAGFGYIVSGCSDKDTNPHDGAKGGAGSDTPVGGHPGTGDGQNSGGANARGGSVGSAAATGTGTGGTGMGGTSVGRSGTGGSNVDNGGSSGAGAGAPNPTPFGECGSVVNCGGELCVDPENPECAQGGCLWDRRVSAVDFYCTKACGEDRDCPAGFVCTTTNVAGGQPSTFCVHYLAECGNGIVDPREACDDGNVAGGDGCSANCSSDETCGNRVVDPGEVCDDGSGVGGDGCSADCASDETCGNGVEDSGEECDDGNLTGEDGCEPDCTATNCGNGNATEPEACDEDAAGCDDQCRIVPVDDVAELGRYPMDRELNWSSILLRSGQDDELFVSWTTGQSVMQPRVSLVSTDDGQHWRSRRSVSLGDTPGIPGETLVRGTTGKNLALWYTSPRELRLRRSSDFGLTWGEAEKFTIPTGTYIPNADMIAAGNDWYVVWSESTNSKYPVSLLRSTDAGRTWSEPVLVKDLASSCDTLGLAADADGDVLVRTCTGCLFSADGGRSFADVVITSSDLRDQFGVGSESLDPAHAIELADGSWVAPAALGGGFGVWRSDDDFATWTERELGTSWSGSTGTALDPSGRLFWGYGGRIVSGPDSVIVLRRSDNGGLDWEPTVTVASFSARESVTWGMASAASGTYVWWLEPEDGAADPVAGFHYVRTRDGGETFDAPVRVGHPENYANGFFSIVPGNGQTVHAFWVERPKVSNPIGYFLYHRRITN